MIRINLLGQIRPKATRRPVDTGAALPVLFIGAGLILGVLVLGFLYYSWQRQLSAENNRIKTLQAQKTELEGIKLQVESFEKQKQVLDQRVRTIEQLQRDRTGGQDLLDMVANTVSRTENLWLTNMTRKGSNLSIEGSSASINAVANFITALKRSGYFQKVEIKETKQDEKNTSVQTFLFTINAEIASSGPEASAGQAKPANAPAKSAPGAPQAKTANTPTKAAPPAAPAKKG
jgi:type IV pilus assembly protein PilN